MAGFVDSLVIGTKCLMYSAEIAGEEEDEEDKKKKESMTVEERKKAEQKENALFKVLLYGTVAISIGGIHVPSLCPGQSSP